MDEAVGARIEGIDADGRERERGEGGVPMDDGKESLKDQGVRARHEMSRWRRKKKMMYVVIGCRWPVPSTDWGFLESGEGRVSTTAAQWARAHAEAKLGDRASERHSPKLAAFGGGRALLERLFGGDPGLHCRSEPNWGTTA
jgi:hypothetical protein